MVKFLEKQAEPEVPTSAAWIFLVMTFGILGLILLVLLVWANEVEQLFGPLQAFEAAYQNFLHTIPDNCSE